MIAGRDRRFELSSDQERERRAAIPAPAIVIGADAWTHGDVWQLALSPVTPLGDTEE
jgi:hypothetical protein